METRHFRATLELRAGGRTVHGVAGPFGQPAWGMTAVYGAAQEDFAPGAVERSEPAGLPAGRPHGLRRAGAASREAELEEAWHRQWDMFRADAERRYARR